MVLMALLVGSDYTTGLQGIGPVTALEILAAFPSSTLSHNELLSGLAEFRRWYQGKATKGPARISLRRKLRNLVLSESFPSEQVVQAYLDPKVEGSREAFSWAKPDFVGLIDFAKEKFGWTRTKSEEILKPILKRLEERFAQTSLLDYFQLTHKTDGGDFKKGMSKRMKRALEKIRRDCHGEAETSETDDSMEKKSKYVRKKKRKTSKQRKNVEKAGKGSDGEEEKSETDSKKSEDIWEKKRKTSKKEKNVEETGEEEKSEIRKTYSKKQSAKKKPQTSLETSQKRKLEQDPDVKVLQETSARSRRRLAQMEEDAEEKLQEEKARKTRISSVLHTKEVIIQKELDKKNVLRSKLRAIEVFRKSKQGPGYVKKRQKQVAEPKADAELSESDSD